MLIVKPQETHNIKIYVNACKGAQLRIFRGLPGLPHVP